MDKKYLLVISVLLFTLWTPSPGWAGGLVVGATTCADSIRTTWGESGGGRGWKRCDGAPAPLGASFIIIPIKGSTFQPPGATGIRYVISACNWNDNNCSQVMSKGPLISCPAGEDQGSCFIKAGYQRQAVEAPFGVFDPKYACIYSEDDMNNKFTLAYSCSGSRAAPSTPDNCVVMSPKNWDIAFGNLERGDISATSGSEKTKDLTLTCTGTKAHDFSIKLNMTPTSWSTSQLATSNPDLGVQVTVGGVAAKLGGSFAMKVTGSGSKALGFSVLRNPESKALDIATGGFSASGTLVVSAL